MQSSSHSSPPQALARSSRASEDDHGGVTDATNIAPETTGNKTTACIKNGTCAAVSNSVSALANPSTGFPGPGIDHQEFNHGTSSTQQYISNVGRSIGGCPPVASLHLRGRVGLEGSQDACANGSQGVRQDWAGPADPRGHGAVTTPSSPPPPLTRAFWDAFGGVVL